YYHPEPAYYESGYQRYDRGGPDYAEVVSAQPIYRSVRVEEPRRECWDEQVRYEEPHHHSGNNAAVGTVIGAVVGGVLGRQIATGGANNAGTAIGAVVGAGVGNSVGRQSDERHAYEGGYERVGYEERCRTYSTTRLEQRVDGYDVAYRYGGRVYHTTMPYDPGSRIPVDVNVRPAAY
ncbi:MAG TPA: glycine zipper 2TM domain-containing protein, partial [Nevskiaceae bacterium]|nr:glycine zipper 2TM domain-containing protein [Nevskiaceae bacterium]